MIPERIAELRVIHGFDGLTEISELLDEVERLTKMMPKQCGTCNLWVLVNGPYVCGTTDIPRGYWETCSGWTLVVMNRVDADYDAPADDPFFESNRESINGGVSETAGSKPAIPTIKPTGPRCRQAVGFCKDEDFITFTTPICPPKLYVQICCGIISRREFDEGPDADVKWARFCKLKKAVEQRRDHDRS